MAAKILVGCDPELFIKKGNKFLSAFGLIEGNKEHPQKVRRGAVQVDGMALEFNIDPAATENEFCINVQDVLAQMKAMVPDYEVVAVPVATFDMAYLKQQPEEALELGCDPDFNGWLSQVNPRPDGDRPFRTASGHVHVGWTNDADVNDGSHFASGAMAARQLDFYLGLPSLHYDKDTQRREMYGKAGCFRPKPYGFEYRTLSNAWLNSEKLMRWVYRNAVKGIQDLMNGRDLSQEYGDIQKIINTSDIKEANRIIKDAKLEVCVG
jgi:hypothetical protein